MKSKLMQSTPFIALVFAGVSMAASTPAEASASHQNNNHSVVVATAAPAPAHVVVTPRNARVSAYEGKLLRMDGQWWTMIDDSFYRVRLLGSQWLLLDAAYMPLAHLRLARAFGFYSTAAAINPHSRTPRVVYLERRHQNTLAQQWRRWQQTRQHEARVAMSDQRGVRGNGRGNGNAIGQGNGRGNANGHDDARGNAQNNSRGNAQNNGRGNGNAHGRN